MSVADPSCLVDAKWLMAHRGAPDIRIVDASWRLPGEERDPRAEFEAAHIPGAVFFDIDEIADHRTSLPHMAPSPEKFALRARKLGLGDGHRIVVYDAQGLFSAARVWWMLRLFGHEDVAVLDGGLPAWKAAGGALEDGPADPRERHFTGRRNATLLRDASEIARILKIGGEQIVDARSPARFKGEAPEPRPGLRAGHIPGARNVFYKDLLEADGRMKPVEALRAAFEAGGVDLDKPIVTSCGSGVTAAILNLALYRLGHGRHALYDGSWAEWGAYEDAPIATGEA